MFMYDLWLEHYCLTRIDYPKGHTYPSDCANRACPLEWKCLVNIIRLTANSPCAHSCAIADNATDDSRGSSQNTGCADNKLSNAEELA